MESQHPFESRLYLYAAYYELPFAFFHILYPLYLCHLLRNSYPNGNILAICPEWIFGFLLIVPGALHLCITAKAHPSKITPNGRGSSLAIHSIAFLSHRTHATGVRFSSHQFVRVCKNSKLCKIGCLFFDLKAY